MPLYRHAFIINFSKVIKFLKKKMFLRFKQNILYMVLRSLNLLCDLFVFVSTLWKRTHYQLLITIDFRILHT